MKNSKKLIHIAIVIALVIIAAACTNPLAGHDPAVLQTGSVSVAVASESRSIIPDVSALVAEYEVRLTNPDHADVVDTGTAPFTFTEVPVGDWDVTVFAYDADSNLIGTGSGGVTVVANGTASLAVIVSPRTSGSGSLDFEIAWSPAGLIAGVQSAYLTPIGGSQDSNLAGAFSVSSGSARYTNGSLAAGQYSFVVRLEDGSAQHVATVVEAVHVYGNVETSGTVTLASGDISQPPLAPDSLTAETSSGSPADTVSLSWSDTGTTETGFDIERSDDGGSTWTSVASVAANVTSYDDTGLSAAVTYSYRVRAANDFGTSSWSAVASATTVEPVDLNAGLVGEWLFGGDLENSSAYNGPAYGTDGTISLVADRGGNLSNALRLDDAGQDQATIYGYDALNSTPDGLTISFWMTSPSGNGRVISRRAGSGTSAWELNVYSGSMRLGWSGYVKTQVSTSVLDQTWNHVVWVFDTGPSDVVLAYVNGVEVRSIDASNSFNANLDIQDTSSTNPIVIGKSLSNLSGSEFDIDDLRIWNRALNESEIAALEAESPVAGSGAAGEIGVEVGGESATDEIYDYEFGSVTGNGPYGPATVRIENEDATHALRIDSIALESSPHFSLDTTGVASSLAPGEFTTVSVSYHPTDLGSHSALVTILSNDLDEGGFTFDVRGGRYAQMHVSPTGSDTTGVGTQAAPFATIGHAIDQAIAGQEVRVAGGTYTVTFPGIELKEGVSLYGGFNRTAWYRDLVNEQTIIEDVSPAEPSDGDYDYTWSAGTVAHGHDGPTAALRAFGAITRSTVVDGFTIRGTTNASRPDFTGAVLTHDSSPTFTNNIIEGGNGVTASSAVNAQAGGAPLFENNTMTGGDTNGSAGSPTTLTVTGWLASPEFVNNTIDGGSSTGPDASTGTIQVGGSGSLWTFRGNTITTGVSDHDLGALMRVVLADAVVDKNHFIQEEDPAGNHAFIFDTNRGDVLISNNLIEMNTSSSDLVRAMYFSGMTGALVSNTVIHSNTSSNSFNYGIYLNKYGTSNFSDMTIRNNLFYTSGSSAAYELLFVQTGSTATVENNYATVLDRDLSADPYFGTGGNVITEYTTAAQANFVDFAGGDYRLATGAAINIRAGGQDLSDDGFDSVVETDFDGNARTLGAGGVATNSGAAGWSIGAFEQNN